MSGAAESLELTPRVAGERKLGRSAWLFVVQLAAPALLALALWWAEAPAPIWQLLLAVVALKSLAIACVPGWRHGVFASVLGGVTLAFACWLAAGKTLPDIPRVDMLITAYVPYLAPIVVAAALALAIWGLLVRGDLADVSRLGVAALAGALLVTLLSLAYLLIFARLRMAGVVESYQLAELYTSVWLYASALWIGSTGLRPSARVNIQPLLQGAVIIGFLLYWHLGNA